MKQPYKKLLKVPVAINGRSDAIYLIVPSDARAETIEQVAQALTPTRIMSLHPDKDGYDPLWSRYYC